MPCSRPASSPEGVHVVSVVSLIVDIFMASFVVARRCSDDFVTMDSGYRRCSQVMCEVMLGAHTGGVDGQRGLVLPVVLLIVFWPVDLPQFSIGLSRAAMSLLL